ncbi:MAG TPA: ABC transporter ATP-binding protein [Gammaproteobacteria bacterium]|nr:ABC transporter ATP-binding protein [Gammaproteobacteria bacterium]
MKSIRTIKKIEIKNLWNKYDIEWHLNEDVNILAGINGIGKTTILDLIVGTLYGRLKGHTTDMVDSVKLIFNNDQFITYRRIKDTLESLVKKAKKDKSLNEFITELKQLEGRDLRKRQVIEGARFSFENVQMTKEELHEKLGFVLISTFDQQLKEYEAVRQLTNEAVSTELDLQLYLLQKQYLEYQINIGKKAIEALSSKSIANDVQFDIDFKKNLFLDTIDALFEPTNKKIDRNKNELIFKSGKQVLTPHKLSSGEKQLVIILLTALIQEDRNCVLFMDEPEISLHTDWQEKLIENIRGLNNNAQIIIATHSPSMVLDGWMDKVFEVPEIITKSKKR